MRDVSESIGKYLLELNDSKEDESDEIRLNNFLMHFVQMLIISHNNAAHRKELQDKKDRIWTDLEVGMNCRELN